MITLNPPIYIDVFVKNLSKRYQTSVTNEFSIESDSIRISEGVRFQTADTAIKLSQNEVSSRAVKTISINNDMVLSSDLVFSRMPIYMEDNEIVFDSSIAIKSRSERKLSDMDELSLEEFDDMVLQNIDTIIK